MSHDAFVESVLHGGDRGLGATLARTALTPLAWLHQAGLEAYLLPFRTGVRKRFRLPVPTIAIGNLSSGGTGKTPMTALVAAHLRDAGHKVALLSRGHGGTTRGSCVVSDGQTIVLSPQEAGDEPVLLANLLPGVPVVVGRDRRQSGRLATAQFTPDVVVLDDALQYWQLHRDLDIVLLDARRPFDNGYVLPRGLLREPPSHLARAGIIVLTRADRAEPEFLETTKARIAQLAPHAAVFTATHAPLGWRQSNETLLPLETLAGRRVFAFAGIADGRAFLQTVEAQGATLADSCIFPDHFAYDAASVQELADASVRTNADAVATTEKDLVKVGPHWPSNAPHLYALRIGMRVSDEAVFFARVGQVFAL